MALDYQIIKPICVITEHADGWSRELNIVSWNHGTPKFDIREWSSDHTKMTKGITLTDKEIETLYMALHNYVKER